MTRFNKRFGVPPAQSTNAYRSPDPDLNLAGILCFKHSRKVARDNTVKYNWHTLNHVNHFVRCVNYSGRSDSLFT